SAASAPPADAPPPQQLGEYKILRELGRGGMGVVYEAQHQALGRRVAVKVLPAYLFLNEKLRTRFRRESQAAVRLHHTNIVPVFDVGEQDGLCWYAMQLITGRSIEATLSQATCASSGSTQSAGPKRKSRSADTQTVIEG